MILGPTVVVLVVRVVRVVVVAEVVEVVEVVVTVAVVIVASFPAVAVLMISASGRVPAELKVPSGMMRLLPLLLLVVAQLDGCGKSLEFFSSKGTGWSGPKSPESVKRVREGCFNEEIPLSDL